MDRSMFTMPWKQLKKLHKPTVFLLLIFFFVIPGYVLIKYRNHHSTEAIVLQISNSLSPYIPINKGLREAFNDSVQVKYGQNVTSVWSDFFRFGYGLENYTSNKGEKLLKENGVVYRPYSGPYRVLERSEEQPSPFSAEMEGYIPYSHRMFFEGRRHSPIREGERKIILWWRKTRYTPPITELQPMRACPDFPCLITTNEHFALQSAAMVFAGDMVTGNPPQRRPEQIFIYNNHEPPTWLRNNDVFGRKGYLWKNVFNWTMTYRLDSDITSFYGLVRRRREPVFRDYEAILKKKSKMVAWIVSNCGTQSKRELYVKELRKYIPVDIYGKCTRKQCPRANDDECFEMINKTYKFYLSFESAICEDYITEKFFKYLAADTITVVRGSNEYYTHAPPEIFLNTADFPSPKALATRILHLASHDDEYIKILKEKDKYVSIYEDYPIRKKGGLIHNMHYHYEAVPFCKICQKLWNLDKYNKTLPDLQAWMKQKLCYEPDDLTF